MNPGLPTGLIAAHVPALRVLCRLFRTVSCMNAGFFREVRQSGRFSKAESGMKRALKSTWLYVAGVTAGLLAVQAAEGANITWNTTSGN